MDDKYHSAVQCLAVKFPKDGDGDHVSMVGWRDVSLQACGYGGMEAL